MTLFKSESNIALKNQAVASKSWVLFSLIVLFLNVSCGKKVDEKKSTPTRNELPQQSELETYLNKQEIYCGSDKTCPEWIAKVGVIHQNSIKYCTGFLTDSETLVTAAHCLPEALRESGKDCSQEVFVFFAKGGFKPERVGCEQVLVASKSENAKSFLVNSDVAHLKLDREVKRKTVSFIKTRTGMDHLDKFFSWTIDQIDQYQGIIRRTENCQVVQSSYFNPQGNQSASPMLTLSGCNYSYGNSGAPVLDYRGRVRAVVSRSVDAKEMQDINFLRILERPLKVMSYISNFACIPLPDGTEVLDPVECSKELKLETHQKMQQDMMNESILFNSYLSKIAHKYTEMNRYIKFRIILDKTDPGYSVRLAPQCFKDVDNWINDFTSSKPVNVTLDIPRLSIRKAMSEHGTIFVQELSSSQVSTNFQFRPKILKVSDPRRANVYSRNKFEAYTYEAVNENCSQLLLF